MNWIPLITGWLPTLLFNLNCLISSQQDDNNITNNLDLSEEPESEPVGWEDFFEKRGSRFVMESFGRLILCMKFRIAPFKCTLCSYVSDHEAACTEHLKSEHPDWRGGTGQFSRSLVTV